MALVAGSHDTLQLALSSSQDKTLVRDYLVAHSDSTIHFSSDKCCDECFSERQPRLVIVTDSALYRISTSSMETGLFLDARTPLARLRSALVCEPCAVQMFVEESSDYLCTIDFDTSELRKVFLLSLCVVQPTLEILQRKALPSDSDIASPKLPGYRRCTSSQLSKRTTPGDTAVYDPPRLRSASAVSRAVPSLTDAELEDGKQRLRDLLTASSVESTGHYDADLAARRPPEEDEVRLAEREKVRAMILAREAAMSRDVEFRVKYPQKAPTRVPGGVEFDKAHEERRALPDDFTDNELLGPSLHPLWKQWKATGGLLDRDSVNGKWTLFDSADLIDSLKAREEVLYGVVGKKCILRIQRMRELVARERHMWNNKRKSITAQVTAVGLDNPEASCGSSAADLSAARTTRGGSVGRSATMDGTALPGASTYTKVQPFRLSSSSAHKRLATIDSTAALSSMKTQFEDHMRTLHELRRSQLQREVQQAETEESPLV